MQQKPTLAVRSSCKGGLVAATRSQIFLLLLCCLVTTAGWAQIVNDGATNTLNNITNLVTGEVTVGTNGSFTLLVLTNNTLLSNSGNAYIGRNAGANSNRVWLSGANTRWIMRDLYVGSNGSFNLLVVSNGAQVLSRAGNIGFSASSASNTVVVTGAGSLWTNNPMIAPLLVGGSGGGNRLVIGDGGQVGDGEAHIGALAGSANNEALVTGSNSFWNHAFMMYVGVQGANNRLVISNGGLVGDITGSIGQGALGSNNIAVVTGAGSFWSNRGPLFVGRNAGGNRLVVENGGRVDNTFGSIGDMGSGNNEALVTGSGSLWSNRTDLMVGLNTSGNRLVVSNGGTVFTASNAVVGLNSGANSNTAIVTGTGARWLVAGDLFLGSNGALNRLVISSGGWVTNATGYIGYSATSGGNEVLVTGTGSVWTNRTLELGYTGSSNRMVISNGGQVLNLNSEIGRTGALSSGNEVIVTGQGSKWVVYSMLMGRGGGENRLLISNGGHVENSVAQMGSFSSKSNEVVVTGAGSAWITSELRVGESVSSNNRLVVSNEGLVVSTFGWVGVNGASNNLVVVTDPGSIWSNRNDLRVGIQGDGNLLVITNGGTVFASNAAYVAFSEISRNNRLVVDGGTLRVHNATNGGTLHVRHGTNVLNVGLVDVDRLVVTTNAGVFELNGGTLRTKGTTHTSGRVFSVGNGLAPATLQLQGGTHTFSNHVVVQPNGTLGGSGSLFGNVTNFGTVNPGFSAGALEICGDLTLVSQASMTFELGGSVPVEQYDQLTVTNFVQFAGTLSLSLIGNYLPEPGHNFTLMWFNSSTGSFTNAPNGGRVNLSNNLASFAVYHSITNFIISDVRYVDTDGDGHPDLFEQAAGTNPQDSRSALQIISVTLNASGHAVVRFPFVFTKSYRVEYSDDLVTWTSISNPVLGNPLPFVAEWIDDGTLTGGLPNGRYYRIGLQ
jgi:fibronectin-binding autotransporter adhesin